MKLNFAYLRNLFKKKEPEQQVQISVTLMDYTNSFQFNCEKIIINKSDYNKVLKLIGVYELNQQQLKERE